MDPINQTTPAPSAAHPVRQDVPTSRATNRSRPPRVSSKTQASSAFVKPSKEANPLGSLRPWPILSADKSPRKTSDFTRGPKPPHHRSQPNLSSGFDLDAPSSTTAVTLSSMRVKPASPTSSRPDVSSQPTDQHASFNAPMGLFVMGNQYIRVNAAGTRFSVPSQEDLEKNGLPAVPIFRKLVVGRISGDCPQPSVASGTLSERSADTLVPLVLSDIVVGLPFEKAVFGTRIPGRESTVVVQVEANRYHAAELPHQHAQEAKFRWLDPDVPADKQLIDTFRERKQQLKTDTPTLVRSPSFRNVSRQISALRPKSCEISPATSSSEAAYKVFTSEKAQYDFVMSNKACMSLRKIFTPETHEFDLAVYRTVLGPDLVFEVDGEWNIGSAAGVADLKSRLRENNFAFAAAETAAGAKVYFSLSGGARAEGVELSIHNEMGDADEIKIGRFTFIDAKRRLARYVLEAPNSPGKTAMQVNLPVLGPDAAPVIDRTHDAEQILATVVAREARDHPLTGDLHFNTLLDTCDSCASALAMLHIQTGRAISVVYHRDYGITTANSRNPAIRGMQELAASANELYAQLMKGNADEMLNVARRLPASQMLESLTDVLMGVTGGFTDSTQLGVVCNGYYLRLLGALTRTQVLNPSEVVESLLSPEGRAYVSLLGNRVALHPMLARGFASLMHELQAADISRRTLLKVLLSKPAGIGRCFYVELLRAPHSPRDVRNPLVAWLESAELVPRMKELWHYVSLRRSVTLAIRLRLQIDSAEDLPIESVTLKELLRNACEDLSLSSLNTADNQRLATTMRNAMPKITIAEQHEYRAMIESTVAKEWKKVLPDSAPPKDIAENIIHAQGPAYGRSLVQARRDGIEDIVERHTAVYAEFQRRNPGASQTALQAQFDACLRAARVDYRAMISDDAQAVTELLTSSATEASAKAKDTATKRLVRDQVEEAAKSAQLEGKAAAESQAQKSAKQASVEAAQIDARQKGREAGKAAALTAFTTTSRLAAAEARTASLAVARDVKAQAQRDAATASQARLKALVEVSRRQASLNQRLGAFAPPSGALRNVGSMLSISSWGADSVTSSEVNAVLHEVLSPRTQGFSVVPPLPNVPFANVGGAGFVFSPKTPSPVPLPSKDVA